MKLVDLNPVFCGHGGEDTIGPDGNEIPRREGVGVTFDCPCGKCGQPCTIIFRNPLDGGQGITHPHATWERQGDTFETLSLTPSILRTKPNGCGWHGFITNGEIVHCP